MEGPHTEMPAGGQALGPALGRGRDVSTSHPVSRCCLPPRAPPDPGRLLLRLPGAPSRREKDLEKDFWWAGTPTTFHIKYSFYKSSLVVQKERIHLQRRRYEFNPWVGKIPRCRKRQHTPLSLPRNLKDRGAW